MNIFKRDDYTRYDFKWYGIGFSRQPEMYGQKGWTFWINSYVKAPWHFNLLHEFGRLSKSNWKRPRWIFSGPMVNPYRGWRFRIGRLFIGGDTPKWMIALYNWSQYQIALYKAKKGSPEYDLCTTCNNGLLMWQDGMPGESFLICHGCGENHDSTFDISQII
jgi:hypothetical protein